MMYSRECLKGYILTVSISLQEAAAHEAAANKKKKTIDLATLIYANA